MNNAAVKIARPTIRICEINEIHPKMYVDYKCYTKIFTVHGINSETALGVIEDYPFIGRRKRWYITEWATNEYSGQWDWIVVKDLPYFHTHKKATEYLLGDFKEIIFTII